MAKGGAFSCMVGMEDIEGNLFLFILCWAEAKDKDRWWCWCRGMDDGGLMAAVVAVASVMLALSSMGSGSNTCWSTSTLSSSTLKRGGTSSYNGYYRCRHQIVVVHLRWELLLSWQPSLQQAPQHIHQHLLLVYHGVHLFHQYGEFPFDWFEFLLNSFHLLFNIV